jgi:GR25 family glycosyltransferase involved in LPS biosynthesis
MTPDLPTYIMHYTPHVDRKKFLSTLLEIEKFTNVFWITEYDREVVTYDIFTQHFNAQLSEWQRRKPVSFDPLYPLRSPEVSLCLKHKHAMIKFYESGQDVGLFLEDDAIIDKNFVAKLTDKMQDLPSNWDVAFIGYGCDTHVPADVITVDKAWYPSVWPAHRGTEATLWRRSAVEKILKGWQEHRVCMPIDHEFSYWIRKLNLQCYWLEPPMCLQASVIGVFPSMQTANGLFLKPSLLSACRDDISNIINDLNISWHVPKLPSIDIFIFSWKGQYSKACKLEQALQKLGKVTVINSDPDNQPFHWVNLGDNAWFTQQWLQACKLSTADILFHIQADVWYDNFDSLFNDAIQYYDKTSWGIYSPNLDYTAHTARVADIEAIELPYPNLKIVKNTDCTCWFVAKKAITLFNNLSVDWTKNKLGWGIDYILAGICFKNKWPVLRDYKHCVYHPCGSGYDGSQAWQQMLESINQCPSDIIQVVEILINNPQQIVDYLK